jgi:hypothetical protein
MILPYDANLGPDGIFGKDRAHRDAIGGLALDAPFIDDVGYSPFRSKGRVGILSLSHKSVSAAPSL